MSNRRGPPPPPPPESFPQPFGHSGSRAITTTPAAHNSARLPEDSPSGLVRPPQRFPDAGVHSSGQPTTYNSTPPSQPPHAHRTTTYPQPNTSAHTHAPALASSHSSSPPQPSSQSLASAPISHSPAFPIPSVTGGYTSTHASAPPPPSASLTQRATTLPTSGQVNYGQPMPYQNAVLQGTPVQSSYSGMPGSERDVSGSRNYRNNDDPRYGSFEDEQSQGDRSGYERERGLLSLPFSGPSQRRPSPQPPQPDLPCRLCRQLTSHREYTRLGGFCSEKHKWDWDEGCPCNLCGHLVPRETYEHFRGFCSASHRDALPCEWCRNTTPRDDYDHFGGFCSQNHRDEANQPVPCRLCKRLTPRLRCNNLGGFCSESHRDALPCNWCRKLTPRVDYDRLGGYCSERHRDDAAAAAPRRNYY